MEAIQKISESLRKLLEPHFEKVVNDNPNMILSIITGLGVVVAAFTAYFCCKQQKLKWMKEEQNLKLEFLKVKSKFLTDVAAHRAKLIELKVPMYKVDQYVKELFLKMDQ